jgi:hypothetical protein
MSFGVSAALQAAVYARLSQDTALTALIGAGAVFDAPPGGDLRPVYVVLGGETVRARGDMTGRGAQHDLVVSVIGGAEGFAAVKAAAVAVSDALQPEGMPALSRGRLVALDFLRAKARRAGRGRARRIDLTFRARVED